MITMIEGELVAVEGSIASLRVGPLTYELLIPAADSQRLAASIGDTITFHTLHYLEAQGQGSSFIPRLIGFRTARHRSFFELFTTVKGVGNRKALRALQLPFDDVASAIASRDADLLKSLPEIGKRTAETIIAELHDRVDAFVEVKLIEGSPADDSPAAQIIRDAALVLTQLGEPKLNARQLAERAVAADPEIDTADALVAAALRLKDLA